MWNSEILCSVASYCFPPQVPCLFKTHLHLILSFLDSTKFSYDYSYAS